MQKSTLKDNRFGLLIMHLSVYASVQLEVVSIGARLHVAVLLTEKKKVVVTPHDDHGCPTVKNGVHVILQSYD